jgi:putative ABC transport system permease protein
MKSIVIAWKYLRARPLAALLNVLLLALGLASINFLLLVQHQVQQSFERDLQGIDVVVGAKGSPLQLILAGVFHIDVPSGNIPLVDVQELAKNPSVKTLIPISLGDSFAGYRIVGTTADYIALYNAQVARGSMWAAPMQSVAGHDAAQAMLAIGVQPGMAFVGNHGLGAKGHPHGESPYSLVGVLAKCNCVLDRLILTMTESVWQVHEKARSHAGVGSIRLATGCSELSALCQHHYRDASCGACHRDDAAFSDDGGGHRCAAGFCIGTAADCHH